jgi:hypothetical protein
MGGAVPATPGVHFCGVLHFSTVIMDSFLRCFLFRCSRSCLEAFGFMACPREMLPASFRCPVSLLIHAKQPTIAARLADNAD